MTSYNVFVGKGARGKFNHVITLKGKAAFPMAQMTAAMVPSGYRAKVEPK
jgi:hypothetical protein